MLRGTPPSIPAARARSSGRTTDLGSVHSPAGPRRSEPKHRQDATPTDTAHLRTFRPTSPERRLATTTPSRSTVHEKRRAVSHCGLTWAPAAASQP
jgi:hypothetical protein